MERIGRRQLLMGAGAGSVALAGLALPTTAASANGGSEDDSLEGAWLVTHVDPTNGSAQSVVTFADGGALASRDLNPPGAPQFGAWAKNGDSRFVATFWSGMFGPGGSPTSPPPTVVLKVIIHGSRTGDHISGTFTDQAFDGFGHPFQSGSGTFTGTRITPGK